LCALLVDGEVYEGGYVGEDVETVLEADFHVVFCGFGAHPEHVVDGVGVFEVEAVVVLLEVVSYSVMDVGNEVDVRDASSSRDRIGVPTYPSAIDSQLLAPVLSGRKLGHHVLVLTCKKTGIPVLSGSIASQPLSAASLMRVAMIFRIP
jgi:hypothetical protein